jgi:cob(I)alamin adenosyltransferase
VRKLRLIAIFVFCGIMPIMLYTKKGDAGTTQFFDSKKGERTSKNSLRAEALGSLDELNSFLGLCKTKTTTSYIKKLLEEVQENLFIVQAELAGASKKITDEKVKKLESAIDEIEKEIPSVKGFSIAGGTELSALLDVARTIARRTERAVIAVCDKGEGKLSEESRSYLNRLSSFLFALARLVNHQSGVKEKNPSYIP